MWQGLQQVACQEADAVVYVVGGRVALCHRQRFGRGIGGVEGKVRVMRGQAYRDCAAARPDVCGDRLLPALRQPCQRQVYEQLCLRSGDENVLIDLELLGRRTLCGR